MSRPTKATKDLKFTRPSRHANRLELKVVPTDGIPQPPTYFSERHVEKWFEVCGYLKDFEILFTQDYHSIEAYVNLFFASKDALAEYTKNPYIKDRVNPAWRVYIDAEKELSKLRDKFGFNPRARQGIKVDDKDKKPNDPFAGFFDSIPVEPPTKKAKAEA